MIPGHVERREFGYMRHSVLALYAALKVHEGEVFAKAEEKNIHEFLDFLSEVYEKWGMTRRLHIVTDNFSAHKTVKARQWLRCIDLFIYILLRLIRCGSIRRRCGLVFCQGSFCPSKPLNLYLGFD